MDRGWAGGYVSCCVQEQRSLQSSRHTTVVRKGWLLKGPDSSHDPVLLSFTRVSCTLFAAAPFFLKCICLRYSLRYCPPLANLLPQYCGAVDNNEEDVIKCGINRNMLFM